MRKVVSPRARNLKVTSKSARPLSSETMAEEFSCSKHLVGMADIDIAKKKAVSKRGVGPGSYEVTSKDMGRLGNYQDYGPSAPFAERVKVIQNQDLEQYLRNKVNGLTERPKSKNLSDTFSRTDIRFLTKSPEPPASQRVVKSGSL